MNYSQWLILLGLGAVFFLKGSSIRLPLFGEEKKPVRDNPSTETASALSRKTGRDRKALEKAFRLSQEFHGTPTEVVELEPSERKVGKYVVVAGSLTDFSYQPGDDSKRGQTVWTHKSGDRGNGKPESPNDPLVVVDPDTRRPIIVPNKSPMRLDSKQGFVG